MNTEWMSQAKCRNMDPAVFFPSDGVGVQAAQRICADCEVARPCLEYALASKIEEGVWGGASERHRRRLLRQRRAANTRLGGGGGRELVGGRADASATGASRRRYGQVLTRADLLDGAHR
ncbi:MAG: WhiB family transcriptional regulator [Acidimicrobiales bacterium]|jgi:WhiB family redox-sensing transcriptional regulator